MRVLVLNANTNPVMTDHVVASATVLAPDIDFIGATGRFGSAHIGTRATYAIAAHAAIDCYAAQTERYDAVILACFGDPGLGALQDIADVPVFGLAEAACRAADAKGRPFSIVTGGSRWIGMLTDYLTVLGLTKHLASIRVVNVTGTQILNDPQGSLDTLADAANLAVKEDGAESVILGGAGLVGLVSQMAGRVAVPLIDCLEPAVDAARAITPQPASPPRTASAPVGHFTGLDAELSSLVAADIAKGV